MSDDAERFAIRAWTVCGVVAGAVLGLLLAPSVQRDLRRLGVDQTGWGPGLVIIIVFAVAGGLVARWATRKYPWGR